MSVEKALQDLEKDRLLCDQIITDNIRKGQTFKFGKFRRKDVEWIILRVWKQERKALAISKMVLLEMAYHDEFEDTTWEECYLRKWLNSDFIEKELGLKDYQKARIMTVRNYNEENQTFGTPGGNPTWDRMFLLDLKEADLYFNNRRERVCCDVENHKPIWWWLRTAGYSQKNIADVDVDGSLLRSGDDVDDDSIGVRPAFFLDLS